MGVGIFDSSPGHVGSQEQQTGFPPGSFTKRVGELPSLQPSGFHHSQFSVAANSVCKS